MQVDRELAFTDATEIRNRIVTKDLSPVEVTQMYLNRIERLDPQLNSYLTVTADKALKAARSAERSVLRGETLGLLHGIPISIKDSENTKGIRTTMGSLIYQDNIPINNSLPVERLIKSGAIILGKTNCPEFALIGDTTNNLGSPCRNPWNPDLSPGGSTGGGAAALAAGLCSISQGSDGGGSIRGPASFCGIYGIKPSLGRVPRDVSFAPNHVVNLFSQHGPLARNVKDAALMLQVLSGWDKRDPAALREPPENYLKATSLDISEFTFGWSPDFGGFPVDPEVKKICSEAALTLEDLGADVEEYDINLKDPDKTFWTLTCAGIYAKYGKVYEEHFDSLMPYTRRKIETGANITGVDYMKALGERDVIRASFMRQFQKFDLLVNPTTAVTAFPAGQPTTKIGDFAVDEYEGYNPFNFNVNMIGCPAASIPCGLTAAGMPVGLQIVGNFGEESKVFAASAAFEAARPWTQLRPTIS